MNEQDERRTAQRRRVLKGGRIYFNGGRSTIDCRVRNLSDGGARLDFASVVGVPDSFQLSIAGDETLRHCRVVWRSFKEIGVEFVEPGEEG